MRHSTLFTLSTAVALALGASSAMAQTTPPPVGTPISSATSPTPMAGTATMQHDMGARMGSTMGVMGKHDMTATVASVDKSTGLVHVVAGGMNLTLHFPPASFASVNEGDSITVHLSFSKP